MVKTLLFGNVQSSNSSSTSDISAYNLVEGTTTIRALFGRGVGIDTTLIIGESEEEGSSGSTIIEVSADLHNDEVEEFPVSFDEELVKLTEWLCGRGTTTAQFFAWADVDNSGEIDMFEFANALRVGDIADLPPWDIEDLVNVMDINSDGRINLPELDIALLKIRKTLGIEFVPYEGDSSEDQAEDVAGSSEESEEETTEESEEMEEETESSDEDSEVQEPDEEPPKAPSQSELKKMKKAELIEVADSMGLDTSGTKADLIERITKA